MDGNDALFPPLFSSNEHSYPMLEELSTSDDAQPTRASTALQVPRLPSDDDVRKSLSLSQFDKRYRYLLQPDSGISHDDRQYLKKSRRRISNREYAAATRVQQRQKKQEAAKKRRLLKQENLELSRRNSQLTRDNEELQRKITTLLAKNKKLSRGIS